MEPVAPPPCADLKALVRADCDAIRRRRRRAFAIFALTGLGAALGMGFMMGFNAPGAGSLTHTALLIAYAVSGLVLCGFAFGLTLPAGRLLRPVVGLGLLGGLALLSLTVNPGGTGWALVGSRCLTAGGIYAATLIIGAVVLAGQLTRRHAPSGALLGVGAGLLGLVPLHMHCSVCSPGHVMVWHGLLPGVAGVLAWLAFRMRRAAD